MVDSPKTVAAVYDRRPRPTALIERRYRNYVSSVARLPARVVSGLIRLYQLTVSPALVALNPTCGCRFTPTCSHYASEALHAHGLLTGLSLTLRRLVKCGPWHPGGEDPVPVRVCRRVSIPPSTSTARLAEARRA